MIWNLMWIEVQWHAIDQTGGIVCPGRPCGSQVDVGSPDVLRKNDRRMESKGAQCNLHVTRYDIDDCLE